MPKREQLADDFPLDASGDLVVDPPSVYSRDASKWREIKPLICDYDTVWDLVVALNEFSDGLPVLSGDESGRDVVRTAEGNAAVFDAILRERVVRCATMLRNKYGLIHADLTDAKLTNRVSGVLAVDPLTNGFVELARDLGKRIIDKSVALNAEE